MEELKNEYVINVTYVDSMGGISTNIFGPYNILDVDHAAAELMRQKLVSYWNYSDDEFIEEVENYRLDGYWEDSGQEWFIKRVKLELVPGFESTEI